MTEQENIIQVTKSQLKWDLKYHSDRLADFLLQEAKCSIESELSRIKITVFLLNLVTAYDVNMTPYLPKEEAKNE